MLDEERTLLAKRWPEMAAKIQKRLLGEGKITKEMIESYVDAYAGIYGDDTDAYVEEIVADTYAGMNRTAYLQNKNGDIYEATLNIADGRDRKILYEVNKVHQVDKTKIPGEHTATGESQHFRYQKTGAGGTQTEDGRTDAPRTFTAGVDGKNAADAGSSKNSISKTGETVKGKMSAQDGRYRDLMGEKAAKYTKGILCAYRKIKKSLSKTREGFLYRCTIIPITPFTKTMRSDKDTSGTPETIRTSDPSLRSSPGLIKPSAT